jgi:hypothetical protein
MSKALNARAGIAVDVQPATKPARRRKFIKELGHVGASLQELWLERKTHPDPTHEYE